jgi:rhodanese-related sulfurtransferase
MFFILVAAGAAGVTINLVHPRGYILVSRPALEARRIVTISSEEAKIKLEAGAVFVDAREREEYENARIRGAVNVPVLEASQKPGPDFSFLTRQVEVVIYCDGPSCGASTALAGLIQKRGYGRTLYVIGQGFPEWEAGGYPVDRGKHDGK